MSKVLCYALKFSGGGKMPLLVARQVSHVVGFELLT